jgi:SAM-dependent methyltransferase
MWRERWREGRTGWDQGGPHRLLSRVVSILKDEGWLSPGRRVLEPGCGRAHNGAALAEMGLVVTAFDVAPEAIDAARAAYAGRPNLTLTTGDALAVSTDWYQAFDLVFDRAVLCALPPEQRRAYVDTCFAHLKPGGLFVSLPFVEVRPGDDGKVAGPPYAVGMAALSELLTPGFAMIHGEEHATPEPRDKIVREMVTIWRRRERALVEKQQR